MVVARSEDGNRELIEKLGAAGIPAKGVATIRFLEPADWAEVDQTLREIGSYDWVALTSPRGVRALVGRLSYLGIETSPHSPRFAAIGPGTAQALKDSGFVVDYVPDSFLTSAMAEGFPTGWGRRVALLRADIADKRLPLVLRGRGFDVKDLAIYRTEGVKGLIKPGQLTNARALVFASASEVRGFRERIEPPLLARLAQDALAVCMGPVTAEAARRAGFAHVATPTESTLDALVAKLKEVLERAREGEVPADVEGTGVHTEGRVVPRGAAALKRSQPSLVLMADVIITRYAEGVARWLRGGR